ncbi:hypothetical protein IscW_ISCW014502 [Ixodes scapularis]|uniref:SWIM-type domain-containing protein n=1 Tax=Ixodes scapularis TaxID=6945 RepID=B7QKX5_IXOSC|nr:hypothetical protein IscW_ISCW014502 [Ixodes scapularis]|eukprot:XP_002415830.1 hypothetical protein IscW_ISCW014502 [Ixodes scapularis]
MPTIVQLVLYDKLHERMPPEAGDAIKKLDQHTFQVPSAERQDIAYHVWKDVGLCTCRVGQSGGFCKHQALVFERFGDHQKIGWSWED